MLRKPWKYPTSIDFYVHFGYHSTQSLWFPFKANLIYQLLMAFNLLPISMTRTHKQALQEKKAIDRNYVQSRELLKPDDCCCFPFIRLWRKFLRTHTTAAAVVADNMILCVNDGCAYADIWLFKGTVARQPAACSQCMQLCSLELGSKKERRNLYLVLWKIFTFMNTFC